MTVRSIQSLTYNPPTAHGASPATSADPAAQEMDFLQLLVSEISNQSPDSPMDPTSMITQYSQMEASIGLIKLNAGTSTYQNSQIAASLMNQQVTIKVDDGSGEPGGTSYVSGSVSAVDFSGDKPTIKINGQYYPIASVVHMGEH